jgi:D-beta-D-heptose 7-phosphate kinase/D-beta-D-heptose 1-phosphate adenosyltransferase
VRAELSPSARPGDWRCYVDTYLEGTASRLCSEAPVPVISKVAEYRLPGGAANVRSFGAEAIFLSSIGTDLAGTLLCSTLHDSGVSNQWLVANTSVQTLHKLRILANGQYVARFDEGDNGFHAASEEGGYYEHEHTRPTALLLGQR